MKSNDQEEGKFCKKNDECRMEVHEIVNYAFTATQWACCNDKNQGHYILALNVINESSTCIYIYVYMFRINFCI